MKEVNFMWRIVSFTNGITFIGTFKNIMIFLFSSDDRTVLFHFSKRSLAWAYFWVTEVSFLKQKCPMGGQNCPFFLADDRSVLFTVFFGQECPFPIRELLRRFLLKFEWISQRQFHFHFGLFQFFFQIYQIVKHKK